MNSLVRLIRELELLDRVRILPNVNRKQLEVLLLSSKVYLHSRPIEHFGISIVEAMAFGCTPVVHDSGGPREFVARDFRYDSIEEAAKQVEKAIDDWSPLQARKPRNILKNLTRRHSQDGLSVFSIQQFLKISSA